MLLLWQALSVCVKVCFPPLFFKFYIITFLACFYFFHIRCSKYYTNAKEIEFDAVAQQGRILNYAISEHVENAGVHSGDATLVLPAQKLYVQTVRQVKVIAAQIAAALNISGTCVLFAFFA